MPFLDRHGNPRHGPAAVCCVCGRFGWIIQIGAPCNWCDTGIYFTPGWFDFYLCSTCRDEYMGCEDCHGKGVFAVPRQDVTREQVDAVLASMEARRNRPPPPVFQSARPDGYKWPGAKRSRRRAQRCRMLRSWSSRLASRCMSLE